MLNKRDRGFERQLLPVGADHHGYIARLKAAFQALGGDPDLLEPLILQFVHLIEGDSRAAMSKRRGEFVTLDELLDEIGVDATRFFMLQSSHDRTLDLNLDLARSRSADNPVYYVQYAHARIASMLHRVGDARVADAVSAGARGSLGQPDRGQSSDLHPSERELIKKLVALPEEIAEAADRRAPHRIAAYSLELAQEFTAFYRDCKVVGATPSRGRVVPAGAVRRYSLDTRAGAGAARGQRAGRDVRRVRRPRSDEPGQLVIEPGRLLA